MTQYKTISDICSGTRTSARKVGDSVTAEDLWDVYVHVPGAKAIINKPIEAMFHNGFEDFDLDYDRKLELEKAIKYRDLFGISAIIFDDDGNVQAWNLKVGGIGFVMSEFDEKTGDCTAIKIYNNPNVMQGTGTRISGRDENFFLLRTADGLAGERGLSKLLNLIDVTNQSFKIWSEYSKYAFFQGLANLVLKVKGLDAESYQKAESALDAPTKDDAITIDSEDDLSYISPMKNAYDPINMLEYGDTYITRESSLNRLQLYGDPTGVLAASDTATANWYAHIKELQDELLPSIISILIKLGAKEKVKFNEPAEYNIATQMNGVLQIRMALDGLVPPEQIVILINRYLGLQKDNKLTALKEKDKSEEPENDSEGFPQNPRGENNNARQRRSE